jgi:putative addiction module killer protein
LIGVDRPYYDKRVIAIAFMEVQPREIQRYTTPDGRVPFSEWLDSLRDLKAKFKIDRRLDRVGAGNIGDYRSVGEGVCELRINFGPGYRVYFGQVEETIVLLLIGGDKSTQEQDIRKAKKYWTDYRS